MEAEAQYFKMNWWLHLCLEILSYKALFSVEAQQQIEFFILWGVSLWLHAVHLLMSGRGSSVFQNELMAPSLFRNIKLPCIVVEGGHFLTGIFFCRKWQKMAKAATAANTTTLLFSFIWPVSYKKILQHKRKNSAVATAAV